MAPRAGHAVGDSIQEVQRSEHYAKAGKSIVKAIYSMLCTNRFAERKIGAKAAEELSTAGERHELFKELQHALSKGRYSLGVLRQASERNDCRCEVCKHVHRLFIQKLVHF